MGWCNYLEKPNSEHDAQIRPRIRPHRPRPRTAARNVPPVRLGACARRAVALEGIRTVTDRVEPAAREGILHAADGPGVVGAVHGPPAALEDARQRGGGHGGLHEERGEDGRHEGLEGLQDEGGQLAETGAGGGGRVARLVVGGPESAGVDVGVEEAGDGEDGDEDGDGRGYGDRERAAVEVDDAVEGGGQASAQNLAIECANLHGHGEQHDADLWGEELDTRSRSQVAL